MAEYIRYLNICGVGLTPADPPKSPLKRGTLRNLAPLCKGGWGDLSYLNICGVVFGIRSPTSLIDCIQKR